MDYHEREEHLPAPSDVRQFDFNSPLALLQPGIDRAKLCNLLCRKFPNINNALFRTTLNSSPFTPSPLTLIPSLSPLPFPLFPLSPFPFSFSPFPPFNPI
jgi:hypothetical protein